MGSEGSCESNPLQNRVGRSKFEEHTSPEGDSQSIFSVAMMDGVVDEVDCSEVWTKQSSCIDCKIVRELKKMIESVEQQLLYAECGVSFNADPGLGSVSNITLSAFSAPG
jgi:hypothetical protein